jgi:hypothetical protein
MMSSSIHASDVNNRSGAECNVSLKLWNRSRSNSGDAQSESEQFKFIDVLVLLFAGGFGLVAWGLPAGAAGRLGPADVPLGLAIAAGAAAGWSLLQPPRRAAEDAMPAAPWRALLLVLGAVVVFALSVRSLGLVPAGLLTGTVAALGIAGVGILRALGAGAVTTALIALAFVGLLGQPLPLWPVGRPW